MWCTKFHTLQVHLRCKKSKGPCYIILPPLARLPCPRHCMSGKNFSSIFLVRKVAFGNYFDHVLSWWVHRDDDNVLFITFEDLKRDPESMVARIATFMGYSHLSQEVIKIIAEKTAFDKMRENAAVNYSWSSKGESDPQATPFMRQGVIGDWKNQFSVEDSQRLDKIYRDRLSGTGLDFCFD